MRRFLPILLLLLWVDRAPAADVTIRWHGQSYFEIVTTKGTVVVIDPHAIDAFGKLQLKANLVLMSHLHDDHTKPDTIMNWKELKEAQKVNALKPPDNLGRSDWARIEGRVYEDVKFSSVGTYHDNTGGMTRGRNGVFVIEVDGLRIVHLGDLGHLLTDRQIKAIGEVDVLMIPVGGVYTINGLDAAKIVEQLKPKRYILPMHYGVPGYTDLLDNKYFLDEMAEPKPPIATIKRYKTNELKIPTDAKVPEVPEIAVLHWMKPS